jgi:phage terminase Nu1 subunit (DNA packaging protein)
MPCHSIEAAAAWKQAQSGSADYSVENLRKERIQLVKSQREKIDIENAARRGELIEISVVREGIIRIVTEAKMKFLRLPNDLPPKMEGCLAATIGKILRAEIISILTELSADLAKPYPTPDKKL